MRQAFLQFTRFVGIGFMTTVVDFAVLNLLASLFDVYKGLGIGVVNIVSFSAAVIHSYFWNKHWAFAGGEGQASFFGNLGRAGAASAIGIGVLGAVIWGSSQEFGYFYYLATIFVLLTLEFAFWKTLGLSFKLSTSASSREMLLFAIVSIIGNLINSSLVGIGTAKIAPLFGLNQELWTNIIKAGATAVSLVWNFVGYKVVVFKR